MKHATLVAALAMLPIPALAGMATDRMIETLQAEGYDRIEVKTGPTQTKIEALRGAAKIEAIYMTATGVLLKQEIEHADRDDDISLGVKYRTRDRDFLRDGDRDDDGFDD